MTDVSHLEALRLQIRRLEQGARAAADRTARLNFGIAAIDDVLPHAGLLGGALHELLPAGADSEHATAPSLLACSLLARSLRAWLGGRAQVLWAMRGRDLFAPALSAAGLPADRLILVEAGGAVLDVMEEALRHRGLLAVVGEIDGRLGLTASRRLQHAAESSGTLGLAIRRSRQFDDPQLTAPSAAASRWRVAVPPAAGARTERGAAAAGDTLGPAVWRLELLRCRGAGAALPLSWMVEYDDATSSLSLAAALADRPADARARRGHHAR